MPWISDDDLKDRILDALQKAELDTSGVWETIFTDANRQAAGDIIQILTGRGWSIAQINAWDRRFEFNVALGIFWGLSTAGTTKSYDDTFIDQFDKRKELSSPEFSFTISGVKSDPAGKLDKAKLVALDTSNDIFRMDSKL